MKRILIVDDCSTSRSEVKQALRHDAYDLLEAKSSQEALEHIASCRPDLVLLDIIMSGEDGFSVLRALRQDVETSTIPVIVISSHAGDAHVAACHEEGAVDHIAKPFGHRILRDRVARALAVEAVEAGPATWHSIRANLVQSLEAAETGDHQYDAITTSAGRIVTFLGVKGGVGTTTTTLNVAAAWAKGGHSVVVAEMTPGFSSVSFQLGLLPSNVSTGHADQSSTPLLEQCLRSTPFGLKLVAAQPWQAESRNTSFNALDSLVSISEAAELVAIDLRFDTTDHVRKILQMTDTLVLVVERDKAALRAAQEAWKILESWRLNCWTGAVAVVRKPSVSMKIEVLKEHLPCQLWSIIYPADEQLEWAVRERNPLVLSCPDGVASQSYIELANKLIGTPIRNSAKASRRLELVK